MPFLPISRFTLRAPLLPAAALADASSTLIGSTDPLARLALELASPDLEQALGSRAPSDDAVRAANRYARRAAFRPTPHGLWAGVAMGTLGATTEVDTGDGVAKLTVSWARLAAVGRALIDDPVVRKRTRLRRAPSLLRHVDRITWIDRRGDALDADVDPFLAVVLDATADWTPWPRVCRALGKIEAGGDLDDALLTLVDDGLLHTSLEPPLLGPPPLAWCIRELAEVAHALRRVATAIGRDDLAGVRALLADLPGAGADAAPLHAVLAFPEARVSLSQAAVERAAALAPILTRLQDALSPPAAERALDPSVSEGLDAAVEMFGAGAYDLGALACGGYGVTLGGPTARPPTAVPARLLTLLVDRLSAGGGGEIQLTSDELDAILPVTPSPPTFELFLSPRREPDGAPPGTGWLLGLHAPAGASWGRFAHALGAPLARALADLAAAEKRARPDEVRLDLGFAPRADLADLTTHPPVRAQALALTSWSEDAVTPADLRLAVDPGAGESLALVDADRVVVPAPLARLRSTTAPPGVYQVLTGWSLQRQHAPWAVQLGPLADLAHVPRVVIDGFVVAPMSWRIPAAVAAGDVRTLAAWRREARVPRHVQIGHEDELLPVDLESANAVRDLKDATRAFEIWPPLADSPVDKSGRRVEAVVAVVDFPDDETAHVAARHVGPVEPQPADRGWLTFKIFGARDRQDQVLVGAVSHAVEAARTAGEIDGWFFQRYVDGVRHHLRVRVHGDAPAFGVRLDDALVPARQAGDVVAVETAPYLGEAARFGGERALTVVEQIFAAESDLVVALADLEDLAIDADELLVRGLDTLAVAFGLDVVARRDLAGRRRLAEPSPFPDDYRVRQRRLIDALGGAADEVSPPWPTPAGCGRPRAACPSASTSCRSCSTSSPCGSSARTAIARPTPTICGSARSTASPRSRPAPTLRLLLAVHRLGAAVRREDALDVRDDQIVGPRVVLQLLAVLDARREVVIRDVELVGALRLDGAHPLAAGARAARARRDEDQREEDRPHPARITHLGLRGCSSPADEARRFADRHHQRPRGILAVHAPGPRRVVRGRPRP